MKRTILGICFVSVTAVQAALIMDEQFSYADGTRLEDVAGWSNNSGNAGRGVVTNGAVRFTNNWGNDFIYTLGSTYSVSGDPAADHAVSALWLHARVRSAADNDFSVRPGVGSSAETGLRFVYAANQITVTNGSIAVYRAEVQGADNNAAVPASWNGSAWIDIYGKVSDDGSGSLKVEFWFDPADPLNPGSADVSGVRPYAGSRLIDEVYVNGWLGVNSLEYDSITVGTELPDVIPEPATTGLIGVVSGLTLVFRRFLSA